MILQLHRYSYFFLFIPHAACVGIQVFSRKRSSGCRHLQRDSRGFPHSYTIEVCWPLSWEGDKKHLSAFCLAWPIPQWIAMAWALLFWTMTLKSFRLANLLLKIALTLTGRLTHFFLSNSSKIQITRIAFPSEFYLVQRCIELLY